ncbi:MAG: transketolase [Gammaproteobacteria bacterium]
MYESLFDRLSQQAVTAIKVLALDAISKAQSGHIGMVLGMANIAYVLFKHHLKHNPQDPAWINRDRFILSNGHGSMLIYALLHLTGYPFKASDLASFRQLGSMTPGHPEHGVTPGIEMTTGPLGQGLATGVGMALAEKILGARFNRPEHNLIDHHTYVFAGDGCLMEGISQEAISLAGTQKLGKLIVFWDDNGISIDGAVGNWFTEDVRQRFMACGWNVADTVDGNDLAMIHTAIVQARAEPSAPWLIPCRTVIGNGLPDIAGTAKAHAAVINPELAQKTRQIWNWQHPPFVIPEQLYQHWDARPEGQSRQTTWNEIHTGYGQEHPELASEFNRRMSGQLPPLQQHFAELFDALKDQSMATRQALSHSLEAIAPQMPELLGSSADLAGSNGVLWSGVQAVTDAQPDGNYLYAGVREFGMTAALNGLTLHGGFRPYGGTFLVFSDYARPAVRLAALMHLNCIFVYSHDSVAVGEDGPTHQPIEHLTALRAMPNLQLWRPATALETAVALQQALNEQRQPIALILSRQKLSSFSDLSASDPELHFCTEVEQIQKGAYIAYQPSTGSPDIYLMASGSEVGFCLQAVKLLAEQNIAACVLSIPSLTLFRENPALQQELLTHDIPRLAVEAGSGLDWYQWLGLEDQLMHVTSFGHSGPGNEVMEHLGLSATHIAAQASALVRSRRAP